MDWGGEEEGEGEMYGYSNMETYNTICKIDSQWEFAVLLRELKQGFCNNIEGRDREVGGRFKREGTYVYLWLIRVDTWQKTTKFCNAIIFQIKKLKPRYLNSIKPEFIILYERKCESEVAQPGPYEL